MYKSYKVVYDIVNKNGIVKSNQVYISRYTLNKNNIIYQLSEYLTISYNMIKIKDIELLRYED